MQNNHLPELLPCLSGHARVGICCVLWSSLFFGSVLRVVSMDRLPFYLCSKYGERQDSAVLATRTRQEEPNQMSGVLQGRGGQGLSGGGGKPEQAEVDAGAVLREGVGVTANPA